MGPHVKLGIVDRVCVIDLEMGSWFFALEYLSSMTAVLLKLKDKQGAQQV